jgi:hypothetical protein
MSSAALRLQLRFWSVWLQAAAAVMLALSAALLLAPSLGLAIFSTVYFLQPEFPVPVPAPVEAYIRFMHGVLAATMLGWMVAVIALARGPFVAGQRHAWIALAASLGAWFLIDTSYSVWHGVWGNVALNVTTALMFAWPLLASRKHFIFEGGRARRLAEHGDA